MNAMEDLKAYVDGELTPGRRAEIEAAMASDEAMRREMEEIRVLSRLIGDWVVQPEPIGLSETMRRLDKARPASRWWLFRLGPVIAAACTLVLLAMITFPLFAQSKQSAKKSAAISAAKQEALKKEMARNGAGDFSDADSTGTVPTQDGDTVAGAIGGFSGNLQSRQWTKGSDNGRRARAGEDPTLALPSAKGEYQTNADAPHVVPTDAGYTAQQLIRTADLTLRVAKVSRAQADATNTAKAFGGYAEDSSSSSDEENLPQAQVTLRVPEKRFEEVLNRLRALGEVVSESTSGKDVTAQVADAEARLKVMKAEEDSYVTMLRGARKVGELLEIKDRLSQVRQEIESLTAQDKALRHEAAYSTITLSLSQLKEPGKPDVAASWQDEAWANAVNRGSALGRWLAGVGMNLLVLAPLWIPLFGGIWWVSRRRAKA